METKRKNKTLSAGRRPLQREIAAITGVSISTVSRVLNQSDMVSADIKERVLAAASQLGHPSAAQELENVLLFLPFSADAVASQYMAEIIAGVGTECLQHGIQLSQVNLEPGPRSTRLILDKIKHNSSDGFLFLTYDEYPLLEALCPFSQRVGLLNIDEEDLALDVFLPDNAAAARIATQHLLQQGHKNILYISNSLRQTIRRRNDSYRATLAKAGIPYNPDLALMLDEGIPEFSMYEKIKKFLETLRSPFTAIACFYHEPAITAMHVLREHGLRVPQDVSVISFDNSRLCAFVDPPLTTVRIAWAEIGKLAVRRLLERAKEPGLIPIRVEVQCRLIERQSVAPPPSKA